MSHWNIEIETKFSGIKNIDIHDETNFTVKSIISQFIERYTNVESFFTSATNRNNIIYKTADITVIIMNNNLGIIDFHDNSAVKTIKVAKREMFMLNNIL